MKKTKLIILMVIIAVICIAITSAIYSYYKIDYVKEFDMSLMVGDHTGIDLTPGHLTFGMVKPGANSATRKISIKNSKDYPLKVNIKLYGDMKKWISVSPESFIINPNENKQISFVAEPPSGATYGNYTGKAKFYFLKI